MTRFENLSRLLRPFTLPLYQSVHRHLKDAIRDIPDCSLILDVGGRKSHYTIGLPTEVTITELPRESDLQNKLHLGMNDQIARQIGKRRSNIREILIDAMTDTKLQSSSYHCVSAVEVLEHVEEDDRFVANVAKVLKNNGTFLMTTPNGDFVENTNPDHKRHYTRQQLESLLSRYFEDVQVKYVVPSGKLANWGRKPWRLRRPVQTLLGMAANFVAGSMWPESSIASRSRDTNHLLAIATNRRSVSSHDDSPSLDTVSCDPSKPELASAGGLARTYTGRTELRTNHPTTPC